MFCLLWMQPISKHFCFSMNSIPVNIHIIMRPPPPPPSSLEDMECEITDNNVATEAFKPHGDSHYCTDSRQKVVILAEKCSFGRLFLHCWMKFRLSLSLSAMSEAGGLSLLGSIDCVCCGLHTRACLSPVLQSWRLHWQNCASRWTHSLFRLVAKRTKPQLVWKRNTKGIRLKGEGKQDTGT
jgi:hypothetical protein